jgi:hypothetical protein
MHDNAEINGQSGQQVDEDVKRRDSVALLPGFEQFHQNILHFPPVVALRASLAVNIVLLVWAVLATIPSDIAVRTVVNTQSLSGLWDSSDALNLTDPFQVSQPFPIFAHPHSPSCHVTPVRSARKDMACKRCSKTVARVSQTPAHQLILLFEPPFS